MVTDLERALEDSLERMQRGAATLEDCLAAYPEHADELARLLSAARFVEGGRELRPSPSYKARARAEVRRQLYASGRFQQERRPRGLFARSVRLAATLAVFALAALTATTAAAQTALPGDLLYDWKLASEQVWRAVSPNRLQTDLALADRRAVELARVAGDPEAQALALDGYRQALARLAAYQDPESVVLIGELLAEHQQLFEATGLDAPIEGPALPGQDGGENGELPLPTLAPTLDPLLPELPLETPLFELLPTSTPSSTPSSTP